MRMRVDPRGLVGVLGLGATLLPIAAHADRAVVCGVNQYQHLQGATLKGCVPDAESMAEALKKYGFTDVKLLVNDQATKKSIVAALEAAGGKNKPNERFVFYFAGHGTRIGSLRSVLLPSDAMEDSEENDLSQQELYDHVRAIPAKSRTVLLDACYSGGMTRSFDGRKKNHPGLLRRYYARPYLKASRSDPPVDPGSKDLVRASLSTGDIQAPGASEVCYFAAATESEQAGEDDLEGGRHGVFTYFLTRVLNGNKPLWGEIQTTVCSEVSDYMEDTQHPKLSAAFLQKTIFEPLAAGATPVNGGEHSTDAHHGGDGSDVQPVHSVWEQYSSDHPDKSKVEVVINPDATSFHVNDKLTFSVKTGAQGYLVVLERGTSGRINLLFPDSANVEKAFVPDARSVPVPEPNYVFLPDAPGTERIKALLFTSKDRADSLMKAFGADGSLSRTEARARDLKLVRLPVVAPVEDTYATSGITFEVVAADAGPNP